MNLEAEPWNVDGTILHVGPGQCRELDRYLATEARHIVLVEPDRDKQRVLRHVRMPTLGSMSPQWPWLPRTPVRSP